MKLQTLTLGLATLVLSACSGGMQAANPTSAAATTTTVTGLPTTPTGTRGTGTTSTTQWYWTQGGQSLLTLDSNYTLSQYAGYSPNSPSNAQINLYFTQSGGGNQGYVKIAYQDTDVYGNSVFHDEEFITLSGTSANYSAWTTVNGQAVFQSFTQDSYGGIIVVIDSKDDADLLSGSVWFKNFDFSGCGNVGPGMPGYCAPQPAVGCWTISLGPYDCQDFLSHGKVVLGSSLYPSSYTRLGSFSGMRYSDVFH